MDNRAIQTALARTRPSAIPAEYDRLPAEMPEGPVTLAAVQFGKISALPTISSPLVTEVHPCDIDGGNEDTDTTIDIYPRWKHGIANADAAPLPQYAVGNVIAYIPFGDDKGMLLGDWILPKGVAAADQYKLVQYGNDGKLAKDWLRFSD